MASQQQDYLLRHIQTISQLIARLRRKGRNLDATDRASLSDALLHTAGLQEQNFGRPATEFLALGADEQFDLLAQLGRERCAMYVSLLRATADLYEVRGDPDLAAGARHLALHLALRRALAEPADADANRAVDELLQLLDGSVLHPPTAELLARRRERT